MKRLLWFCILLALLTCAQHAKAQPPAAGAVRSGQTQVQNAMNGNCLYNNAGVLGNKTCGGGGAPPAGPDTAVQYKVDATTFGGSASFTYDSTDGILANVVNPTPVLSGLGQFVNLTNFSYYLPSDPSLTTKGFRGVFSHLETTGSSDTGSLIALDFDSIANNSGNVSNVVGLEGFTWNESAANVLGSLEGINQFSESDTGAVVDMNGFHLGQGIFGGSVTNLRGLWIEAPMISGGSVTNNWGVLVDDQTGATNNWAIKTGLGLLQWGDREQEATIAFASLPATTRQMEYCSDCTVMSGTDNTCAGSGTGAHFEVINGVKKCWQ